MGWSYDELMDCPYEEFLNYKRIMTLESKEEQKEKQKQQRKVE